MVVCGCEIWQVRHSVKQQLRTAGAEKWVRLGKDTQGVVVWLYGQVQVLLNAVSLKKQETILLPGGKKCVYVHIEKSRCAGSFHLYIRTSDIFTT